MKQKRFRTVQSFLVWFEEQTNRKLYIKVYSDSSGEIGDAESDESLFKFENSTQLAKVLDKLVNKYKLEKEDD